MFKHPCFLPVFAMIAVFTAGASAHANLSLPIIDQTDLNNIASDMAGTFTHSSVSPASGLGDYFGFEFGVIGGITYTPHIYTLVNESAPNNDVRYLPHINLLMAFSIPMGIKIEATFLPSVTDYGITLQSYSGAILWNLSDTILPLPFELAVRIHESLALVKFDETVSGVTEGVQISSINQGIDIIASDNFGLVEPYAGIGGVKTYGEVKLSGPNSIFSFTNALSASADVLGFELLAGVNLRYKHGVFGLEIADIFNDTRALTKISAVF
jgi:hypothetical protein